MKKLNNQNEIEQFIKNTEYGVIIFSGYKCPDCHHLNAYIDEVINKFTQYTYAVCYREDNDNIDYFIANNILGIPSLITYHQGKIKNSLISKLEKSQKEVEEFLNYDASSIQ